MPYFLVTLLMIIFFICLFFLHVICKLASCVKVALLLQAFVIHSLLFLGCMIWSIALPHSQDAVFLTLVINCVSILLDIIILAIHYPALRRDSTAEFSAVMAVFNLLLRFVTAYVLHTEVELDKSVMIVHVIILMIL